MNVAHAQRAAMIGAKMTALTTALVSAMFAAYASGIFTGGDSAALGQRLVAAVPFGLLVGALAGLVVFGIIGVGVALLGVKRVGWTFVYAVFGTLLAAFAVQPAVTWIASIATDVFAVPAGAAVITALAALIGCLSGILVARGLKDGPDV